MGDFRRGGNNKRFGARGGFGGQDRGRGGFGRNRDRGSVTMHEAVCNQCGKPCEVPFRPTQGKPVYCNACFSGKKETGNSWEADRFSQNNYSGHRAPADQDFRGDNDKKNNDEMKKQLELLNGKMDLLIKAVEAMKRE
jgi:CxxC-x17-CxxC domain-containing protein